LTARSAVAGSRGRGAGTGLIALAASGLVGVVFVLVVALTALGGASVSVGGAEPSEAQSDVVSTLAETEIPPLYLRLYQQAAARYGLDWAILAGIGKVECDHGRDPDPSCTQEGAVNSAGAGGPMQFIASTWAQYGVDGEGDGPPDRWNPADAIFSAANYLRASGAPADYRRAIYAYNHAQWYVEEVESWARKYSAPPTGSDQQGARSTLAADPLSEGGEASESLEGADVRLREESTTPVHFIPGERAALDPGDGHVALVPAGVPATVQAMVVAGNELQDLPYGPGGHPDPLGATEEDCSSTVNYVLYRAGVRPLAEILHDNPLAQDYVNWGAPGPGRWVTIYASASPTPHVFMTIAGLRLDTSHDGTDVGPNRDENGPRWRILDHIPTWAHWSVRHPPGL
jgi:hypothetical protein